MSTTVYTSNGQVLVDVSDNKWLAEASGPEPIVLPANTIRAKFSSGYTPTMGDTQTLVDSTNNIWDIYKQSNDWSNLFNENYSITEIIAANTSNITNMSNTFYRCIRLTSIPLFDTSNVTDMSSTFQSCSGITSLPLFDTSSVLYASSAFQSCSNVESGALALYNQMSTQTNVPQYHYYTFRSCGSNTTTGAAELEQIPSGWK